MIWWPESIPVLEFFHPRTNSSITLRPVKLSDAEDIYRAAQDPEVSKFTTLPADYTLDMAIAFSGERAINRFVNRTELIFIIEDTRFPPEFGSSFAGVISLHTIDIPNHKAEIGYWLAKQARNKGIGTQAAEMLTEYGLMTIGFRRIEALVNANNEASKKLLIKAGYEFEGLLKKYVTRPDGNQIDMALFAATKS